MKIEVIQHFNEADSNRAVEVARRWLKNCNPKAPDELRKKLQEKMIEHSLALLEVWKWDYGVVEPSDKNKRRRLLEKLKPWECVPLWIGNNPVDLFIHIWVNKYIKIEQGAFFDYLASLIIFSGEASEQSWIPSMVREALWLSEIQNDVLYKNAKKLIPPAMQTIKNTDALLNSQHSRLEQQRTKKLRQDVHAEATYYIKQDIPLQNIVGMIHQQRKNKNKDGEPLSARQIRRHLQDHYSGHWATKNKK